MSLVNFRGRMIDPIALWEEYVEFPPNWNPGHDEFSPLVRCPNPEHATMKRHFQVNITRDTVHCFAHCGISGSYENAIAMIEGVTHRQARRIILRRAARRVSAGAPGLGARRVKKSVAVVSPDALVYERYIPAAGMEYLKARRISPASVAKWELGWDADDLRLVIPAKDAHGRLKFLIRRAVRNKVEPKYLYPKNSNDRNRLLFGACHLNLGMVRSEGLIVVEGSIDTILQHQEGFENTVGILGSHLSEIQARLIAKLRPPRVITMFDADGAGVAATISTARGLPRIPICVARYPRGKTDPAELLREERERVIARVISYSRWQRLAGVPKQSPKRKEIRVG